MATVAPGSIVSAFGNGLLAPGQTTNDVKVTVTDSANATRSAIVLFASAAQVNFVVPPNAATGQATVSIGTAQGIVQLQTVAPGLFSAAGNGKGVAAAIAVRTTIPTGFQSTQVVFICDAVVTCQAVGLDLGVDAPLTLELFGTGISGDTNRADISVMIGGQTLPVMYGGPQLQFAGLDQVNVALPLSLRGAGMVNVTVVVAGQSSNTVQIDIQ
jgi:uncharacterized protein (TIGR03437 family)